ncbi:CDP-diacylglycerol--glycerol-3-phosphate 3-phosphatidyltransferase [Methylohalomonas lacus]|uniref:CDP-diacylglycerol--glycerol-3-phosphate 3-phosphatidyltransferase n=1 Tax=Methylohalomonas lacus TaxID=398773 RepID=A0AAE3HLS8_9GAMM|nr:CDP-diacylglycerol--glycerol-3-phosphate 3-phosphatidyltransferase [Methylohalomonas lacus]MCS3902788.1 CDP-diacylglycerol--glycerol-3-phosphate 3-phosphatidyltransferase [Methylohalomonas lacus]
MNIPNTLTFLRIALIPVFVLVFYAPIPYQYPIASVIFIIAALTDLLDGYLARRLDQVSPLGAFLDPVADKLMVAVVLILLVQRDPSAWIALPAAIIVGREITISALREWMAELGARSKVAVSVFGKFKTSAQMVALALLVYQVPAYGLPVYEIGVILLYIAAILTLVSMCQYLASAWPKLMEKSR